MPRPTFTECRGLLVSGYADSAPPPWQQRALDAILRSRRHFPAWLDLVDTRDCGHTPDQLLPLVAERQGSCLGVTVLDETQVGWANDLSRAVKARDRSIRTVVITLDGPDRPAIDLEAFPAADAAITLEPILLDAAPPTPDAPQFPAWRLAGASFLDTLLRAFAGEPLQALDGLSFRSEDGAIRRRARYRPTLFGDAYYGSWEERTAVPAGDQQLANARQASLRYGEVTAAGGVKLFSERYCDVERATVLYDLGMGTGRLALQAFATCPWLEHVVGVELSDDRYRTAARGARAFAVTHGLQIVEHADAAGPRLELVERVRGGIVTAAPRRLEFMQRDLFDVPLDAVQQAQVVLLLTHIPQPDRLNALVRALRPGTRLATNDALSIASGPDACVTAIPTDRPSTDGFATSFSPSYHYFVWRRDSDTGSRHARQADTDEAAR